MNYINVEKCLLKFYLIDLEVLFSASPFGFDKNNSFDYAKPCEEISIVLNQGGKHEIPLLERFSKKNFVLEVDYGTYTTSLNHYATELKVNVLEMMGIIKVIDSFNKPRAGIYVKVYANIDGSDTFYKDGYTDIR